MMCSALADVLGEAAPVGAALTADELDGVPFGWAAALLLGRGAGPLERVGVLPAVGPVPSPAGAEVTDGGWLVTGTVGPTGAELAGAGTELARAGAELAGTELDAELLAAGELGCWGAGGVDVRGGVLDGRVEVGAGVTGTLGVGRLVLDGPGLPVLAQLSRMVSEVTTVPSRAITRTWYRAGLETTWRSITTEALGSSKLIRVPSGSVPASRPSWRTSSTV